MRPPPFEYADPRTVGETLALLAQYGDDAKVLAGGQSLLPLLNFRVARPERLIDINHVSELNFIRRVEGGGLEIGALTRHRAVELSELVRERAPLLSEAIQHVGHVQIRNRGTLGGSLAHADPGAELPTVLAALGGAILLRSQRGARVLGAAEFFLGQLTTAIEPDELLVSVTLPPCPDRTGSAWAEFSRRQGDFALAGAGALVSSDAGGKVASVRLALMNVGVVPFDASEIATSILAGRAPDDDAMRAVAAEISMAVEPTSDVHATADYRKHLAGVMARQALAVAAQRATRSQREQMRWTQNGRSV